MSYSINKVKESIGLLSPSDLHSSVAIKQFGGAFSMGTSQRCIFCAFNNFIFPKKNFQLYFQIIKWFLDLVHMM